MYSHSTSLNQTLTEMTDEEGTLGGYKIYTQFKHFSSPPYLMGKQKFISKSCWHRDFWCVLEDKALLREDQFI